MRLELEGLQLGQAAVGALNASARAALIAVELQFFGEHVIAAGVACDGAFEALGADVVSESELRNVLAAQRARDGFVHGAHRAVLRAVLIEVGSKDNLETMLAAHRRQTFSLATRALQAARARCVVRAAMQRPRSCELPLASGFSAVG